MFDVKKYDLSGKCEAGYEMELVDTVTGEGLGAFITVRGKESPTVKRWINSVVDQSSMEEFEAKRRGKPIKAKKMSEIRSQTAEAAIVRTIGWRGFVDGEVELKFSEEAARTLYRQEEWIAEQIIAASNDLGNFLRPTGQTSVRSLNSNSDSAESKKTGGR